jgi:glycosyltransferase involved in cell wall biosynthesis
MINKNLMFLGDYPPPYGGIASHLNDLLPALVDKEYETYSITVSKNNLVKATPGMTNEFVHLRRFVKKNLIHFSKNLIRFIRTKNDLRLGEYFRTVAIATLLEKRLLSVNPSHLFVYTYDMGYCIPMIRLTHVGKKLRIHIMLFGGPYERPQYFSSIKYSVKKMIDSADSLIASSSYCAHALKDTLGLNNPFQVIYVGVDENVYTPRNISDNSREKYSIPENARVALFVGRMHKEMGLDIILNNLQDILDIGPEVHLIIAGAKGPLSAEAKRLAKLSSRVHYIENFPFKDKPFIYKASDILLSPTLDKHACMGVSIKEAMATGMPIVASTSGGIPEAVVDKENGYLIPIKDGILDSSMFIERISHLLNNDLLCQKMSESSRKRAVTIFSNKVTVSRYLTLIRG